MMVDPTSVCVVIQLVAYNQIVFPKNEKTKICHHLLIIMPHITIKRVSLNKFLPLN